MRGYPKHINTQDDLVMAMEINPARAKAWVISAIDHREGWVITSPLADESDGVTDATHRVINQGDDERGPDWYQQEWLPLPGNDLDRIGLSVEEAEGLAG
jgi:hypothetical protein